MRRLKLACYTTNITMAVVGNLPPVLFLTFRDLYDISYSLLGLLVLINFVTQLTVDLILSFFSHKFNIPLTVKLTPAIGMVGLLFYAATPLLFAGNEYVGLVLGTVIFSAACGLAEVLISPVIAALPAKDPDREMSKLHSIYAWGVVFVIIFSTLFLQFTGKPYWPILTIILAVIPLISTLLFAGSKIPAMDTPAHTGDVLSYFKNPGLWLCVGAIFLGGASECTMAQWSSGYLEQAVGLPKVWGDIFGVAMFGMMLGLGRSMYAKIGKNLGRVLFFSAIGATVCYLVAALSPLPIFGLVACGLTGLCTAMMWPGSLVVAEQRFPTGGVFIFAIMAAGGDLGASVGPQLIGIITDAALTNPAALSLANTLSLSPEQLGMKTGMLIGALFPLIAIFLFARIRKNRQE
ncbi:MAG: MFS transporter [Clostridia bacterium]|nr:MFS transporter [Clostridia bacterium]